MEYKASYTGDFAVAPGGPVVRREKGQDIDISDPIHAQWLLNRNVIYQGGNVRQTKDVTAVETKDTFEVVDEEKHLDIDNWPLHKRNKKDLILYGGIVSVELDMSMGKKEMLAFLD